MDSKDTSGITAVRAHFLTKAGGEASILDRQVLWPQPLVPVQSCNGLLRGGNQVLLIIGAVIRLLAAFADDLQEEDRLVKTR